MTRKFKSIPNSKKSCVHQLKCMEFTRCIQRYITASEATIWMLKNLRLPCIKTNREYLEIKNSVHGQTIAYFAAKTRDWKKSFGRLIFGKKLKYSVSFIGPVTPSQTKGVHKKFDGSLREIRPVNWLPAADNKRVDTFLVKARGEIFVTDGGIVVSKYLEVASIDKWNPFKNVFDFTQNIAMFHFFFVKTNSTWTNNTWIYLRNVCKKLWLAE